MSTPCPTCGSGRHTECCACCGRLVARKRQGSRYCTLRCQKRHAREEAARAAFAAAVARFTSGQQLIVRGDVPGGVSGKLPPIPDGEVVTVFEDYGESHVGVMRTNGQLRVVAREALHQTSTPAPLMHAMIAFAARCGERDPVPTQLEAQEIAHEVAAECGLDAGEAEALRLAAQRFVK